MVADILLMPLKTKRYKVFLVEEDDDDRERVLSGLVEHVDIVSEPFYNDVRVDYSDFAVKRFLSHEEVTMTLRMVPRADGTYLIIENFAEEDDE